MRRCDGATGTQREQKVNFLDFHFRIPATGGKQWHGEVGDAEIGNAREGMFQRIQARYPEQRVGSAVENA